MPPKSTSGGPRDALNLLMVQATANSKATTLARTSATGSVLGVSTTPKQQQTTLTSHGIVTAESEGSFHRGTVAEAGFADYNYRARSAVEKATLEDLQGKSVEEPEQELKDCDQDLQEMKQSLIERQTPINRLQRSPERALRISVNEANETTAAVLSLDDTVSAQCVAIDHLQKALVKRDTELLVSEEKWRSENSALKKQALEDEEVYYKEKDEVDRQLERLQKKLNETERERKRLQEDLTEVEEIVRQANREKARLNEILFEMEKESESLRIEANSPTGQLTSNSEVQAPPRSSADRTPFLPNSSQVSAQDTKDSDHTGAPLNADPNLQPPSTEYDFCFLLDGKTPHQAGNVTGPKSELLPAILAAVRDAFAELDGKKPHSLSRPGKGPSCIEVRANSNKAPNFKDGPGACCHMCRRKRTPCIITVKGLTPMFVLLPLAPKHRDKEATQGDIGFYIQPLDSVQ